MNAKKYKAFPAIPIENRTWPSKRITKAPIWCSVDLRDGNQALIVPMSLEEKLEFFKMLVKVGFKEIEIGFPAASETEYEFCRTLIEKDLIPDDVTIQVLTQAREHIIKKTFEAIRGCKQAIVHLYNSTSVAQREQVFKKDKEDIIKIAMNRVYSALKQELPGSLLVMQVHDELIVECDAQDSEKVSEILKREMEAAAEFEVPLAADVHTGKDWLRAK